MSQLYVSPEHDLTAFNCPNCGAYAHQVDYRVLFTADHMHGYKDLPDASIKICSNCNTLQIWYFNKLIFPAQGTAPLPNNDMPPDVLQDYLEAKNIVNISPRGAAALLRLAIQKLCKHLGESGKNINADISGLVSKGLAPRIQKALDIVRVVGNEAVHPGTLDLSDDHETAGKLFVLTNLIVDAMITQPNEVDQLFNSLPVDKLTGIEKRDNPKPN